MAMVATNDLDYLAVRLHARRSRMAEGEQLDGFCRSRNISDLGRAVRAEYNFSTAADFQRALLADLIQEYSFCLRHLAGAEKQLVGWMQSRFQIENLKVLLRGLLNRTSLDALEKHLLPLPRELAIDAPALLASETPVVFAKQLPAGLPRKCLEQTIARHSDQPDVFLFEAVLDGGYFSELFAQIERLANEEKKFVEPIARQQVEQFHLRLAVRGKFIYGYSSDALSALRVPDCGAAGERFKAMLTATDLSTVAGLGLGHVFDEPPAARRVGEERELDPAAFESLASRRLLRLANVAFRRSHIGFATVVAYLELRRIEVANLITISEGVRLGAVPESIRARLARRTNLNPEVQHV